MPFQRRIRGLQHISLETESPPNSLWNNAFGKQKSFWRGYPMWKCRCWHAWTVIEGQAWLSWANNNTAWQSLCFPIYKCSDGRRRKHTVISCVQRAISVQGHLANLSFGTRHVSLKGWKSLSRFCLSVFQIPLLKSAFGGLMNPTGMKFPTSTVFLTVSQQTGRTLPHTKAALSSWVRPAILTSQNAPCSHWEARTCLWLCRVSPVWLTAGVSSGSS